MNPDATPPAHTDAANTHASPTDPDHVDPGTAQADERDAAARAGADRMPTREEERAAERAERDLEVDRDEVASHEQEMNRIGANVKGEGEIPS